SMVFALSNVANQRVTKQAPPQTGCAVPPAASIFSPADGTVRLYFEAVEVQTDSLTAEWYQPNGTRYTSTSWNQQAGSLCFFANLDISGLNSSVFGSW